MCFHLFSYNTVFFILYSNLWGLTIGWGGGLTFFRGGGGGLTFISELPGISFATYLTLFFPVSFFNLYNHKVHKIETDGTCTCLSLPNHV